MAPQLLYEELNQLTCCELFDILDLTTEDVVLRFKDVVDDNYDYIKEKLSLKEEADSEERSGNE